MKITYYTNKNIEILSIKDDNGNPIKEKAYHFGDCIIDVLYGHAIVENGKVAEIGVRLKNKVTELLEKCDDYLHNNIKTIVETDLSFVFDEKYSYQNVFIENKLCSVYFFDDIYQLICLLLTNIYLHKLMYKRCVHCHRLFATRFSTARFCKRIATKNGKSCRYAYLLKMRRKKNHSLVIEKTFSNDYSL